MSTRILYVRIKYSMYDLICDVISCCFWSCDMGKINVFDKIVMKKKKRENMEIEIFIHKSSPKKRFWNRIYSLLRRADVRRSADTIYCMWRISLLCGPGTVNYVTKVGHAQIIYYQRIVLWCLIHTLTLRRNLISLAIFNAIFWKIDGGLLFWATLYIYNTTFVKLNPQLSEHDFIIRIFYKRRYFSLFTQIIFSINFACF